VHINISYEGCSLSFWPNNEKHSSLYGDKAPSYRTMKKWYNEFNLERSSLQDDFREGRPKSAVTP
jgi:hypothetical protein